MKKDPVVYLKHILEAIDNILLYTKGMSRADLLQKKMVQDAVVRDLEIIGEATKCLPVSFRNKSWRGMEEDRRDERYFDP